MTTGASHNITCKRTESNWRITSRPGQNYDFLPSGTKVANVRMGETYRYAGKDGKQISHTNWHSLTFYDDLADAALTCEKGDNLFVEGSLQQRQFTPADGVKRTIQEVVVRSFHVIALSRVQPTGDGDAAANGSSNGRNEYQDSFPQGGIVDADWPVGPA